MDTLRLKSFNICILYLLQLLPLFILRRFVSKQQYVPGESYNCTSPNIKKKVIPVKKIFNNYI